MQDIQAMLNPSLKLEGLSEMGAKRKIDDFQPFRKFKELSVQSQTPCKPASVVEIMSDLEDKKSPVVAKLDQSGKKKRGRPAKVRPPVQVKPIVLTEKALLKQEVALENPPEIVEISSSKQESEHKIKEEPIKENSKLAEPKSVAMQIQESESVLIAPQHQIPQIQNIDRSSELQFLEYAGHNTKQHIYNLKYRNGKQFFNVESSIVRARHPRQLIEYLEANLPLL